MNYYWPGSDEKIKKVMTALGFENEGRIYINKSIAYSVEFPPGPLSIGEEHQIKPIELKLETENHFYVKKRREPSFRTVPAIVYTT